MNDTNKHTAMGTYTSAKKYLQQLYHLDRSIKAKRERLRRLNDMLYSLPASAPKDIKVTNKSRALDPMGDAVVCVCDLKDEYARDIAKMVRMQREIEGVINQVPNENYRQLLEYRYLNFMGWYKIQNEMKYSERHIRRIHKNALTCVDELLKNKYCP